MLGQTGSLTSLKTSLVEIFHRKLLLTNILDRSEITRTQRRKKTPSERISLPNVKQVSAFSLEVFNKKWWVKRDVIVLSGRAKSSFEIGLLLDWLARGGKRKWPPYGRGDEKRWSKFWNRDVVRLLNRRQVVSVEVLGRNEIPEDLRVRSSVSSRILTSRQQHRFASGRSTH